MSPALPPAVEAQIRAAIAGQNVITCTYLGHPRTVHPLVLFDPREGSRAVACWQIAGTSSTGRTPPFWDTFTLSRIADLVVTPEVFTVTPEGYNPASNRYARVLYAVPRTQTAGSPQ